MLLKIGGEADAALSHKAKEVEGKLGELTAAKMKVTKLIMEMDKWMKAAKDEVQPAYACMMSAHEYVLIFLGMHMNMCWHAHEYVLILFRHAHEYMFSYLQKKHTKNNTFCSY